MVAGGAGLHHTPNAWLYGIYNIKLYSVDNWTSCRFLLVIIIVNARIVVPSARYLTAFL